MRLTGNDLMRVCHEAHIRLMANHNPEFIAHLQRSKTTTPIPDDEAAELFEIMEKRFTAWTGKTLAEFTARAQSDASRKKGE